jgi:hypothetical protein
LCIEKKYTNKWNNSCFILCKQSDVNKHLKKIVSKDL